MDNVPPSSPTPWHRGQRPAITPHRGAVDIVPLLPARPQMLESLDRPEAIRSGRGARSFQLRTERQSHRHQHSSRLRSPTRDWRPWGNSPGPSLNRRQRRASRSRSRSPKSTARNGLRSKSGKSACPKCLGRFPHDVRNCNNGELWDGSPARCQRDSNNHLVNPQGQLVCTDWQRPLGCHLKHAAIHECSGCGNTAHGAQDCAKAQTS